jgi:hypothetical protein
LIGNGRIARYQRRSTLVTKANFSRSVALKQGGGSRKGRRALEQGGSFLQRDAQASSEVEVPRVLRVWLVWWAIGAIGSWALFEFALRPVRGMILWLRVNSF